MAANADMVPPAGKFVTRLKKARIAARPSCLKSQTLAVFVASKSRQGHCASRFFERQREDGGGFLA
ncbi:MAG: hypothetical protein E5W70_26200 [Mesorhizobium sp.]|nr:MAG: hypothetical protein E5W70_26200 [Mesorhizobium sp.]